MGIYIFLFCRIVLKLYSEQWLFSCASTWFQILWLGSRQVSDFNHMYFKKIKRSLFGTPLTHLKKLCLCVRFKNNWNQGCKNLKSSSRMFWLQLLPRALKGTEWKLCAAWGTDNSQRGLTWNGHMWYHRGLSKNIHICASLCILNNYMPTSACSPGKMLCRFCLVKKRIALVRNCCGFFLAKNRLLYICMCNNLKLGVHSMWN